MLLGQIGLVAAYVIVALLLLSINLYSRWSWRVKAGTICLVSLFYGVTYFSIPPLLGWPTDGKLPERFNLVAAHIQEPDKLSSREGTIYLWVTEFMGKNRGGEPRAYRVPFTPELHARVMTAVTKLRKGLPQLGELESGDNPKRGRPKDDRRGGQTSVNVQFYDLPDPLFPEK